MNVRRPFAPHQPAETKRPAFGALWALVFLAFTAGAALLWTGIAEAPLVQLQGSMGPNTKFLWLGAIFVAAILLPAVLPKGAAKLRGFQIWSLLLVTGALASAVVLRRDALPDTAKAGTRAAIGLFAGAAFDDPKAVLADLLTGENYQLDLVPAVPPNYAEAMTRASAKATAATLVERHLTYVGLAARMNTDAESALKLDALKGKLTALQAQLPTLDERVGLESALGLQAEVTAALLVAGKADPAEAAKRGRAAADRAKNAAANAVCQPRGETLQCALTGVLYAYEREGGRWRITRPKTDDTLRAIPFLPALGVQAPTTAPNPKGDELARARFAVEQVMRTGIRITKKRAIDPDFERALSDDAVPAQLGLMESLMALSASTTEYEAHRYATALKAEQIADGTYLDLPSSPEAQAAVLAKRTELLRCQGRAQLKKAIARWNLVFPNTPPDAAENALVDALVQGVTLERATPTEFKTSEKAKVVLANGAWQWWEPRTVEACPPS